MSVGWFATGIAGLVPIAVTVSLNKPPLAGLVEPSPAFGW
jgi:hypothetical protein